MSIDTAKKCFDENLKFYVSQKSQPEKFNLYQGLYNIADEIEKINLRLDQLDSTLDNILSVLTNR
jgi:hypothetical protein